MALNMLFVNDMLSLKTVLDYDTNTIKNYNALLT